jgi:hypothetical protein
VSRSPGRYGSAFAAVLTVASTVALAAEPCGEPVTVKTHAGTTTRYAYAAPKEGEGRKGIALLLLPGGGGHLDLDEAGCPRALKGNSLVRSAPLFRELGYFTALVDAPSDMPGEDGLAGFRVSPEHAADLAVLAADLRARSGARVWLVGTSRGSISAANAAARLTGPEAPAGVVLTSALMSGQISNRRPYVAQTVFDLPLEAIRIPLLVVGHAADACARSPAALMGGIVERAGSVRKQAVTVRGGKDGEVVAGLAACEGRSPHGFIGQEGEVAAGIDRFIGGGAY